MTNRRKAKSRNSSRILQRKARLSSTPSRVKAEFARSSFGGASSKLPASQSKDAEGTENKGMDEQRDIFGAQHTSEIAAAPCTCSGDHNDAEPEKPSAGLVDLVDENAAENDIESTILAAEQLDANTALSPRPGSSTNKHIHISVAYEEPLEEQETRASPDDETSGQRPSPAPAAVVQASLLEKSERVVLSPSTTRVIAASEVARHNSCEDCWIMAHGRVYDVTTYIFQHPGGAGAILRNAGTDATAHFDFHSKASQKMWASRQIGVVDRPSNGDGSCIIC